MLATAVSGLGDECGRYASCLELAGKGLQRIRTDGWTGKAADAFWERHDGEPKNWLVAADSLQYTSETQRRDALASWLHEYNHHRPHSAT